MSGKTLYARLFWPFAIALALTTLLAWWLAVTVVNRSLELRVTATLQRAAEVLVGEGLPLTDDLLQRTALLTQTSVFTFDRDGAASAAAPATAHTRAALREAFHGAANEPVRLSIEGTAHLLVVRRLPPGRDQRYAAVGTLAPLAEVREAGRSAGAWLGLAGLIAMVLLAWIGHRIARSITQPIQQLSALAAAIAGGDRGARIEQAAGGEIGVLTSALNDMAASLQRSERELARQNRLAALGEMAARIAHEVRNPLTAMKLQLQLLQERVHGDNAGRITRLLDEMRRLELVVDTTLESSRKTNLQARPTNLNRIVDEVTQLMAPSFKHRGLRLTVSTGELPDALLDTDRIKQVLLNLLTNAADALPDGGDIRVTTAADSAHVRLVVEDSGPGIPDDKSAALFAEPVESTSGGLGVGLLLTRELAELHGGRVAVDSSEKLGGARLTVYFPVPEQRSESRNV